MKLLSFEILFTLISSSIAFQVPSRVYIRKTVSGIIAIPLIIALASQIPSPTAANNGIIAYGTEEIMQPKGHGTSDKPVQEKLRWAVDVKLADRITNYNRHYAEFAGYFQGTNFLKEEDGSKPITFYDSVTGKPLFIAPQGRSFDDFKRESTLHGWPSFRDNEVVWENVRVLSDGETVSTTGTHLGHNLPDLAGNRYCINLVSVAGYPAVAETEEVASKEAML